MSVGAGWSMPYSTRCEQEGIVTESDWATCTDPQAMLSSLWDRGASDRKFRLYACAMARWLALGRPDGVLLRTVELVEQGADAGTLEGCREGLAAVRAELIGAYYDRPRPLAPRYVSVGSVVSPSSVVCLLLAMMVFNEVQAAQHGIVVETMFLPEDFVDYGSHLYRLLPLTPGEHARYQRGDAVGLLRDIFGDPFREVMLDPAWRTEAVVGLARGMYETRNFSPMPVLADALEDAGCADPGVLAHCRATTPHTRGCFVVDAVLGKS
jgi:biotin carboxyl carrier protein